MREVRLHRPLLAIAVAMAALGLVCLGGVLLDDRTLLGAPIWLKPLKFTVSMIIYTLTLAWLISLVERRRRLAWWVGTVVALAAVIEMSVIVGQVVRGRASHFNAATPLDSALFGLMGLTIVVLWVATAILALILWRQKMADRPAARAIRLGLLVALGGLGVGFLMTSPTPEQLAAMEHAPPAAIGAHSVGVPDGGPGLPLLGWSTEGGDLRAGHFIGMHALQALPLLALGLAVAGRRLRRLRSEQVRARLVAVGAGGYAGLTVLVTWQALRGQPLIHPDALTAGAAAALLAATAAAATWALAAPTTEPTTEPSTEPLTGSAIAGSAVSTDGPPTLTGSGRMVASAAGRDSAAGGASRAVSGTAVAAGRVEQTPADGLLR